MFSVHRKYERWAKPAEVSVTPPPALAAIARKGTGKKTVAKFTVPQVPAVCSVEYEIQRSSCSMLGNARSRTPSKRGCGRAHMLIGAG